MSLKGSGCSFEEVTLSNEEIKPAFFSLRGRKSRGFDEVNYDIVKQSFKSLLVSLKYNFDLSLKNGSFPEKMKIARVIPAFKSVNTSLMTNYRPISALSFFSKILERKYDYINISRKTIYYTVSSLDFKRGALQNMQLCS